MTYAPMYTYTYIKTTPREVFSIVKRFSKNVRDFDYNRVSTKIRWKSTQISGKKVSSQVRWSIRFMKLICYRHFTTPKGLTRPTFRDGYIILAYIYYCNMSPLYRVIKVYAVNAIVILKSIITFWKNIYFSNYYHSLS